MTDETTEAQRVAKARAQHRYGVAPVVAVGVLVAGLAGLFVSGAIGAANAMTSPHPVAHRVSEAPPTPSAGVETPVAEPSTPPDRDSDQTEATSASSTVYVVRDGDTLTKISALHGVSVDSIAEFNGIRNLNVISAGAKLRIPVVYLLPQEAGH